ncbi:MAG: hypothetical protein PUB12_05160 [[Clostridium] aminophilum]|uniref:hypothetical protein n=1 Tax=[Clostridium] aminophilum TaxID=1526 RepID=UPI0026ECEF2B|nr:hypothetical protein [[Clostridium] aminophilum]MDD6196261.1 hypothetical protein [[Clostridium] aminophilum]
MAVVENDNLIEQVAILLQRRYNIFTEIWNLTNDLLEAAGRRDDVSVSLLLDMRQESLEKCEENWQELKQLGENPSGEARYLKKLVFQDPDGIEPTNRMEHKILDLRVRLLDRIREVKEKDRMLSLNMAQEKSYYSGRNR